VIIGEGASRLAPPGVVAVEPAADTSDILRRRYALAPGDAVLLRPDGHVAARFHAVSPAEIAIAIERLEGRAS
jgi:3-(3-hydroxy-phenyl)propionate hydroxylase